MSDSDQLRRDLGGFPDKEKQSDSANIRKALDDLFYAQMNNTYRLPYPDSGGGGQSPIPPKPVTPKPTTTPVFPPRQASPIPTGAAPSVTGMLGEIQQGITNNFQGGQQWAEQNNLNPIVGVGAGIGNTALQGLGALGEILGAGVEKVGEGANWLDEAMTRDTNAGTLPTNYKPFTEQVADLAGQYNERIQEPVAGIASKLVYDEGQGLPLFPGKQDYGAIVQDLAAGNWNDALWGRPQEKQDTRAPANNAASAVAAGALMASLAKGDVGGALDNAFRTFGTFGNEEFDRLDAGDKFAASLLFDPLNFIPGAGVHKLEQANKLGVLQKGVARIDDAAKLLPDSRVLTPMAKVTEAVKSAMGEIGRRTIWSDNADEVFGTYRAFEEAGKDAKAFDAVIKKMTGMDTIPAQRASRYTQGIGKIVDEMEQGYRATQTFLQQGGDATKLPKTYSKFLDDVKAGRIKPEEAEANLLELTKTELAERSKKYMSDAAAKLYPKKGVNAPVNIAQRFMNNLKAAEALVYIGLSPFTFVRNVVNGLTTMAIEGVNPLWDAVSEINHLKKIGQPQKALELERALKYQEILNGTGQTVREAFGEGGMATAQTGAFGSFMSKMMKKTKLGKPLEWYQKIENAQRAQVWSHTYNKVIGQTWTPGKAMPKFDAGAEAVFSQYGLNSKVLTDILQETGPNPKEAWAEVQKYLKGQRGPAPDWDAIAAELGMTRQQAMAVLDHADHTQVSAIFKEVEQRVMGGEDKAAVADEIIAREAAQEAEAVAQKTGQAVADVNVNDLEAQRGMLVQQWNDLTKGGTRNSKQGQALLDQIEALEKQIDEAAGIQRPAATGGTVNLDLGDDIDPDLPTAPAPEPTPPDMPPSGGGTRLTPDDIKRQEQGWLTPSSAPDPNTLREFARELAAEKQLPNILRGIVDPEDWIQMSSGGRQTLLERTLATRRNTNPFPLSDVYQGKGDVPTAMPDVTGVAPVSPDFSDVLKKALDMKLVTVRSDETIGAPNHLLAVLNKHKAADAPAFNSLADIKGRTAEVSGILDNYTPSVKTAKPAPAPKPTLDEAMVTRRKALDEAIKTPRHEYPSMLSDNVKDAATELKFQLVNGEKGDRISRYDEIDGRIFQAVGSSNAPFYKELFSKYTDAKGKSLISKDAILAALNKIIKDKGSDKGVTVERVKEIILQQLAEGLDTSAGKMNPDWEARMLLGYSRDKIDEAYKLWDDANQASNVAEDVVGTNAAASFGDNITPPAQGQGQMFTQGEDAPLFSGTPQTAKESAFIPEEQAGTQGKMFSTAPEFGAKKKKPKGFNASDAQVRGIDPNEMHTGGDYRQRFNAAEAIDNLRQVAQEAEPAASVSMTDEMVKAKAAGKADLYEALLRVLQREDMKRAQLGTDVENRVNSWLRKSAIPAMDEMRQAAIVQADWMDNAVMISRDGETKFDAALGLLSPFQFWRTRFAYQSMRRVFDKPARLAWYLKLREGQDQVQDDPRYPKRLRGMAQFPIPGIPAWAGGGMWFDPLESATSLEAAFGANRFEDEVTDADVAESIRVLAQSGEISLTEAQNVIANQSGALWEQTKMRLQELSRSTAGADAVADTFRPHTPFDIIWKLKTGNAKDIGVLFPMTRLIRGATGVNVEQPLKAGLRQITGAKDIPDWDMWDLQRTDRALADMVGDGLISERDAMIAMIERKGPAYEQAQQRAQQQMSMQTFSVFGGQLFPEGEKEYYKSVVARTKMLDEAVASVGGNPADYSTGEKWDIVKANGLSKKGTPLGDFYSKNPVYGTRNSVYDEPEARLKNMLADEIWGTYNNKGKLDRRLMADDLGEEFKALFLSGETRDMSAVTLDDLGEWTRKVRGYVPEQPILQVGEMPEVRYGSLDQNERYTAMQDKRDSLFNMDVLGPKLNSYSNLSKDDKRAYRDMNNDVDAYLDWYGIQMKNNPDLGQLLNPDYQAATGSYVNARDAANDITRYTTQNLDNMIRRIGGRNARGGGGGASPFVPTTPTGKPPVLSTKAKKALAERRKNPRYFIERDVFEELLAYFRASGGRGNFNVWLDNMVMGGVM